MPTLSRPRLGSLLALGAAVLAGALAASTSIGPYAVAGIVVLCALFAIPARWLPVVGLLLFLVPFEHGPEISAAVRAAVVVVPFVVYYIRRRSELSWSFGMAWVTSWLVVVGVLSALQGLRPGPSLVFLVPVVVLVAMPLCLREMPAEDQRLLIRAWVWAAIVLAVYGLAEFIAAKNPIDAWYSLALSPLVQKWDTYRITTTIGHPLLNGMFFAATFALCCAQLLERSAIGSRLAAVGAVAGLGATVLSGSRSALIAAAAGAVVVSLAASSRHPAGVKWGLRIVLPVGLLGAFFYVWTLRLTGLEADTSVSDRRDIYSTAAQLIDQRRLLGAGPGYAWEQNELYGAFANVPLESSVLELVVGWGLLGAAVALAVGAVYVGTVVRRGRAVALAPLATVVVSSFFFNFIEGEPRGLLLVCAAVLLAVVPARRVHEGPNLGPAARPGRDVAPPPARRLAGASSG